jgi:diguanylate cyclase (GGDEF)-like protein
MSTMSTPESNTHLRAFALTALLLLLLGAAVIAIADRYLADARAISAAQQQLTALVQIGRAEREAIAVQRAYLLTGDVEHRDRFQQGIERVALTSAALRRKLPVAELDAERFAALQNALDARLERARLVVATNDRDGAQAALDLLRDSTSLKLENDVRDAVERLSGAVEAQLAKALQAAERSAFWLLLCAALGAPVSLLALGLGYLALRREVRSRQQAERASEAGRIKLQSSVEQLTQMSNDMQRLSAYAGLLQTCDSTEEVLDVTRVCFAALLPDYSGMVYLMGKDRKQAQLATEWGLTRLVSADQILPSQCWAWRRAQPFVTDSQNAELRCTHLSGDLAATATACLPLNAHGETFGLLYIDGPEPLRYERLAATAAEQLSLALANLNLRESLREQSIKDALTGLYNRRHLEQVLPIEYARCRRGGHSLAVLMLDIDHFKRFNDSQGHAAGDALLGAVGRLLDESCVVGAIACRYGGEEFTVILPQADVDAATARAESIRAAIANLRVDVDGTPLPQVTASIGVASVPGSVDHVDDLIDAADRALYRAKSGGRNRVMIAAVGGD